MTNHETESPRYSVVSFIGEGQHPEVGEIFEVWPQHLRFYYLLREVGGLTVAQAVRQVAEGIPAIAATAGLKRPVKNSTSANIMSVYSEGRLEKSYLALKGVLDKEGIVSDVALSPTWVPEVVTREMFPPIETGDELIFTELSVVQHPPKRQGGRFSFDKKVVEHIPLTGSADDFPL